jgi:hypothetical protein
MSNFDLINYLSEGRLLKEESKIDHYRIEFKGLNNSGAKRLSNQFEKYGDLEINPNWKNYFKVGDKLIGPKKIKQIKDFKQKGDKLIVGNFDAKLDKPAPVGDGSRDASYIYYLLGDFNYDIFSVDKDGKKTITSLEKIRQ